MSPLKDLVLGRPLTTGEGEKQRLSVLTGVPVLGLDALASTGYGPEAALTMLAPAGVAGLHAFPLVMLAVVVNLGALYVSYRQTQAAYPNGGGAYVVATTNLGRTSGVCAAVALMLDYVLNVAVAISAGVAAVVSAIPALHAHTLWLCLGVLLALTLVNLRGVRESGLTFAGPVYLFIACIAVVIGLGLIRVWQTGGHPRPLTPLSVPAAARGVGLWMLLRAFASGCTAMTGVEAVSNGVPLFREPRVRTSHRTLTVIAATLGLFLLGAGALCLAFRITAMDQQASDYQTVLSLLIGAVAGRGAFYYVAIASVFAVLTFSAQTSFSDFPRVCRLLAEDRFLPPGFAKLGRRLVFSRGIVVLAVLAATLLIVFRGVTDRLIPLFAIGAFSAFLFSQLGMVLHWKRAPGDSRHRRLKLLANGFGAAITGAALVIIILAKFAEGGWVVIGVAPALVLLLERIHRHYERVGREIEAPLTLPTSPLRPPLAIVPVEGWNRAAEKALRYALQLSNDVIALHVSTDPDDRARLEKLWEELVRKPARASSSAAPRLEVVDSPYRRVYEPILQFIQRTERENPDRLIALVVPELAEPRWYEALLHNVYGAGFKTALYQGAGERTIVVYVPLHIHH